VVAFDITQFFPSLNHDMLMALLAWQPRLRMCVACSTSPLMLLLMRLGRAIV
jgi:hypothetical protein